MIDDLASKIFKIDVPDSQNTQNEGILKSEEKDSETVYSIKDLILNETLLPLQGPKPVVLIDTRNDFNSTQFYQVDRRIVSFENKECGILLLRNITSLKQMTILKSKVDRQAKMTESVTKETLIPLKYIIQFAKALLLTIKKGEISNKISLILSIAKVLEAKI